MEPQPLDIGSMFARQAHRGTGKCQILPYQCTCPLCIGTWTVTCLVCNHYKLILVPRGDAGERALTRFHVAIILVQALN